MSEQDADEKERSEAEALAKALEGSTRDGTPPDDALRTAALLRYSGEDGALSDDRADSILAGLDAVPLPARKPAPKWWRTWLPLGVSVAAAAGIVVAVMRGPEAEPATVESAPHARPALPAPGAALLSAQADLASGDAPTFEPEMRAYREEVLRALERTYPIAIGALADEGRPK